MLLGSLLINAYCTLYFEKKTESPNSTFTVQANYTLSCEGEGEGEDEDEDEDESVLKTHVEFDCMGRECMFFSQTVHLFYTSRLNNRYLP